MNKENSPSCASSPPERQAPAEPAPAGSQPFQEAGYPPDYPRLLRETREALQQSEQRFRVFLENSSEAVALVSGEGIAQYASVGVSKVLGFPLPEFIGRSVFDFVHPDHQEPVRAHFAKLLQHPGSSRSIELRCRTADQRWIWIRCHGRNLLHLEGIEALVSTFRDITEEREYAQQIKLQASLLDQVRNSILASDTEGRIIYWNRFSEELYLWKAEEVLGGRLVDILLPPVSRHRAAEIRDSMLEKGYWEGELMLQRKDGSLFPGYVYDTVLRDEKGAVSGFVGITVDITERQSLEAQLRHAVKMESIGQLAGGVAHDFNNMLTVIQGHASVMLQSPELPPRVRSAAEHILEAADRAANLTRQLLTFSRRHVFQPTQVDVNQIVQRMGSMLQRILGEDVQILLHTPPGPLSVKADGSLLEQVLLNMAINARDAMPAGGTLRLQTDLCHLDAASRPASPEAREGSFVRLTIQDSGTGIAPEHLEKIFEPFFTTKPMGKGTGLGLATVYGIVQQHQGWIDVFSQPGLGTTFQVYLEHLPQMEFSTTARRSAAPVPRGHETILLVEDEEPLRHLVRSFLEEQGYRVLDAPSGPAALALWRQHQGAFDLLLTDMVMPGGMTGGELAEQLVREKPGLRFILTTGYSAEINLKGTPLHPDEILQKPFTPDQLYQIVRQRLDATPPAVSLPAEEPSAAEAAPQAGTIPL